MQSPIRLGVAGLGRAFMLMLPTLARDPRIRLVAACDPRADARDAFAREFGGRAYDAVDPLAADPGIEAVYVATPHALHASHVVTLAAGGKHILVEKPMAPTLADCSAMVAAATRAGVHLLVGHSHSFDRPYLEAARLVASGTFGRLRMMTALNYTDFVYRPRRVDELDPASGGVVLNQAAHQVDVARLLGGGMVSSVRAATHAWDETRPIDGAYQALLAFDDGTTALLAYSGYGHFDSDSLMGWHGELGQVRRPGDFGRTHERLTAAPTAEAEAALKAARGYGGASATPPDKARGHNHFGFLVASCERADLRPTAHGVEIHSNGGVRLVALAEPSAPRSEVVDELWSVLRDDCPPLHSGAWGRATIEVCLAMLQSATSGKEISLRHQVAAGPIRIGAP